MPSRIALALSMALLGLAASRSARGGGEGAGEENGQDIRSVARQVQNPLAGIVALQIQNDTNYWIGPFERTQNVMNLQPVVPIHLHEDVFLISLARIPLVWIPDVRAPTGSTFGMGDITLQPLLSSHIKRNFFFGVGPVLRFPTGTDKRLGPFDTGQFSIGPAGAFAFTPGPVVFAVLVHNAWSVAGRDSGREVNKLFLQPVLDYNLPRGLYLTIAPTIVADWTVPGNKGWIVPVGGGVGWVGMAKRANVAFDVEVQAYWNVVRPDPGPPWTLRFQLSLFFPKPAERTGLPRGRPSL